MSKGISISEKHGVNPSLMVCMVCGESTGVALLGKLRNDEEAPRKIIDQEPCKDCREKYLKEGTMLLGSKSDGKDGMQRTGSMAIIKDSLFERIFNQKPPERKICFTDEITVLNLISQDEKLKEAPKG